MDTESSIRSFQAVTGASEEESRFFLESHNWDIDLATSAFLDSEDADVGAQPAYAPPKPAPQPVISTPSKTSKPASKSTRGGIRTLSDFGGGRGDDEEEGSDEDDSQKYYAGGEKSGQMIQFPKGQGKDKKDVVDEVFDSAKKRGAKSVDEMKSTPSYFSGQGYKLGDSKTPTKAAPGAKKSEQHIITFWKNGFTVDNGPLRQMDDPANREFLEDVNRGVVPHELERDAPPGVEFSINLVDNRTQEWKEPPKPKVVPFSGSGHTLGSTSTTTMTPSIPISTTAPVTGASSQSFSVDDSKPTTSIQLRLHDGTRLVAKFNHTHTVADIRKFVDAAKRLAPGQQYDLMTTFPPKALTDFTQTIADAGLVNAVIVQKLK